MSSWRPSIGLISGGAAAFFWVTCPLWMPTTLPRLFSLDLEMLFAGVMNWAAIQAGFVFAAYASVRGNTSRFAMVLKSNGTMKLICTRLFRLTLICIALAAASLVGGAVQVDDARWPSGLLFALWLGLTIYAFVDFIECILIFRAVEKPLN
jgi:hypothetical protein